MLMWLVYGQRLTFVRSINCNICHERKRIFRPIWRVT